MAPSTRKRASLRAKLTFAVSLAVFLIACSYLVGRVLKWHKHDGGIRLIFVKFCGLMGLSLAATHALICGHPTTTPPTSRTTASSTPKGSSRSHLGVLALGLPGWRNPSGSFLSLFGPPIALI